MKHGIELTCLLIADGGGTRSPAGYLLSSSPEMSDLSSRIKPLYMKKGVSRVCPEMDLEDMFLYIKH